MVTCLVRTVIMYILLVVAVRLTGKRQIGELQVSELVITYMLSELAVFPITDKNVPLLHSAIPIVLLLSLEVVFSFLQTKSNRFRRLFSGGAVAVISKGRLDCGQLTKNRIDLEELLGELRLKGVFDVADVEYAFLEENGKLSVLRKSSSSPLTPESLELESSENGSSHIIIADGKIRPAGLTESGLDARRFAAYLKKRGLKESEIFLMTADDAGNFTFILKNGCADGMLDIETDGTGGRKK